MALTEPCPVCGQLHIPGTVVSSGEIKTEWMTTCEHIEFLMQDWINRKNKEK